MARGKGIGDLWKYDPTYIMAKASKKIAGTVAKKGPKVVKKVTRDPMNFLDPTRGIGNTIREATRSGSKPSKPTRPGSKKMPNKTTVPGKPSAGRKTMPAKPSAGRKPMPMKKPVSKRTIKKK